MHRLSRRTQVQLSSNQAVVKTPLHLHTQLHVPRLVSIHALTRAHKHALTQSHSSRNTPKHTHYTTHKHTSNVSRSPELAVCKLPSFQGKTWPFTSILVFACANCQAVQTLPWRWCLKAHSVSQRVQVILPKLLTRLVRNGCSSGGRAIRFLWSSIVCGIRWCGSCAGMMARE